VLFLSLPVEIHLHSSDCNSKIRVFEVVRSVSESKCRLVSRDHHAIAAVQYSPRSSCLCSTAEERDGKRNNFSRGCQLQLQQSGCFRSKGEKNGFETDFTVPSTHPSVERKRVRFFLVAFFSAVCVVPSKSCGGSATFDPECNAFFNFTFVPGSSSRTRTLNIACRFTVCKIRQSCGQTRPSSHPSSPRLKSDQTRPDRKARSARLLASATGLGWRAAREWRRLRLIVVVIMAAAARDGGCGGRLCWGSRWASSCRCSPPPPGSRPPSSPAEVRAQWIASRVLVTDWPAVFSFSCALKFSWRKKICSLHSSYGACGSAETLQIQILCFYNEF
jgi:hypothetical protein